MYGNVWCPPPPHPRGSRSLELRLDLYPLCAPRKFRVATPHKFHLDRVATSGTHGGMPNDIFAPFPKTLRLNALLKVGAS